jgi:hypothetical protein
MYIISKYKGKSTINYASRVIVFYSEDKGTISILVKLIVPIEVDLDFFKVIKKLKSIKLIVSQIDFKLSTSLFLVNALNGIFFKLIEISSFKNSIEFVEYLKTLPSEESVKSNFKIPK